METWEILISRPLYRLNNKISVWEHHFENLNYDIKISMRLRQPVPVYNKAKNGFILCIIFIIFIIIIIMYFMFYFFKVCMETDISTTPSFGKIFFPFFWQKFWNVWCSLGILSLL